MFMRRVTKLPTITSKYEHDLTWALQPIFVWLQVLGIPTGQIHLASTIRRYTVLFIGVGMMLYTIFSVMDRMLNYIRQQPDNSTDTLSGTEIWIDALQEFQTYCATILISLSFYIAANVTWIPMWKNAVQIEQSMRFDKTFYRSIRNISTAALTLLALETAVYSYRCFSSDYTNLSITATVLKIGFWFTQLYPVSAIVFFMVLTWTASMMLQYLVDQLPSTHEIPPCFEVNQQLLKWKLKYESINDYIEEINSFFGVTLLGYMTKQLFNVIVYIYWLAVRIQHAKEFHLQRTLAVYLFRNLMYIFLVSFVSYRIKQKVYKADRRLRDLKISDNTIQCQVDFIIIDINLNSPKITAMGVFEIGPNLIPSFIGIVLTYLVILCQFEGTV